MLKLIIYLVVAITSEMFFYKLIRKLDKKERKILQTWEDEYIDKEIDKIKANKLNYKTTKRKKNDKNDTENSVHTDINSQDNS